MTEPNDPEYFVALTRVTFSISMERSEAAHNPDRKMESAHQGRVHDV
jgi:hypothetical protein